MPRMMVAGSGATASSAGLWWMLRTGKRFPAWINVVLITFNFVAVFVGLFLIGNAIWASVQQD